MKEMPEWISWTRSFVGFDRDGREVSFEIGFRASICRGDFSPIEANQVDVDVAVSRLGGDAIAAADVHGSIAAYIITDAQRHCQEEYAWYCHDTEYHERSASQ